MNIIQKLALNFWTSFWNWRSKCQAKTLFKIWTVKACFLNCFVYLCSAVSIQLHIQKHCVSWTWSKTHLGRTQEDLLLMYLRYLRIILVAHWIPINFCAISVLRFCQHLYINVSNRTYFDILAISNEILASNLTKILAFEIFVRLYE